jgi:hypothetical protein
MSRRLVPCQFCGREALKKVRHEGKPICQVHRALKQRYLEIEQEHEVAEAYRARIAARQQVATNE